MMWPLSIIWDRNNKAADNALKSKPEVVPVCPLPPLSAIQARNDDNDVPAEALIGGTYEDSEFDAGYDGIDPHADGRDDFEPDPREVNAELADVVNTLIGEELAEGDSGPEFNTAFDFMFDLNGEPSVRLVEMWTAVLNDYSSTGVQLRIDLQFSIPGRGMVTVNAIQYQMNVREADVLSLIREARLIAESAKSKTAIVRIDDLQFQLL